MGDKKLQRTTRQRTLLLEILQQQCFHPTAVELYEAARTRLPKISLGTVYRNLELLAQSGVIRKLQTAGAEARFDGNTDAHYHVRCVHCERLDDVHDLPDDFVKGQVHSLAGYDIVGFRLYFLGVCPDCQSRGVRGNGGGSPGEGR